MSNWSIGLARTEQASRSPLITLGQAWDSLADTNVLASVHWHMCTHLVTHAFLFTCIGVHLLAWALFHAGTCRYRHMWVSAHESRHVYVGVSEDRVVLCVFLKSQAELESFCPNKLRKSAKDDQLLMLSKSSTRTLRPISEQYIYSSRYSSSNYSYKHG